MVHARIEKMCKLSCVLC